jgi:hypothetical protein
MMENDNTSQSVERSLAVEEMKVLSSMIGRTEAAIYQKQGWLFTLITGLAVVVLKNSPLICREQFALISIMATVIFYVADVIQRVPVYRAIARSKRVEKALRENWDFDSPKLSESLGTGNPLSDFFESARRFRVWAPYLLIIVVILAIYLIAP